MKYLFASTLSLFIAVQIFAQTAESKKIEQGILISSRLDSDDDFAFDVKGSGFETGYYFLKKLGRRGMLSIDARLAYSQSIRNFNGVIDINDFRNFRDSLYTSRTGAVDYENLSLSLPIKYRHLISEKVPVFFLVGFNPYFNLWNNSIWQFDEFENNSISNMIVSENLNQEEELKQKFYSRDLILAGFGYKKNKLMFDIYFSGGSTFFDSNFVSGFDKLSFVFNVYYQLN
ncbi:MAG: hypothetical protein R2879_19515 [Saprospiraceae bacterium]